MSAFHELAKTHKLLKPDDSRSVEELEQYYRDMQNNSPFGKIVQQVIAADTANMAIDKARIMAKASS